MPRCLLLRSLFAAVAVAPLAAAVAAEPERVVNVAMEDQFRNRHETLRYRGDVVVLVYAGRKGAEDALELGRRLHLRFHPTAAQTSATEWSRQPVAPPAGWPATVAAPDVHVIPIACLAEVPKSLHAVVKSRFRKESPSVAVWLDFEDTMRQRFGIVPDEPNVAVIDARGCTQGVLLGHLDEVRFGEVTRTIDQLRLQTLADRTAVVPTAAAVR